MAGEELLDRMAARLRSYSIFGQDDEDRAVLSAYDAHRQRAGEDDEDGAVPQFTYIGKRSEHPDVSYCHDGSIDVHWDNEFGRALLNIDPNKNTVDYASKQPDPATVRVPLIPTRAMLEAGARADDMEDMPRALWAAMLSAAEAER